MKRGFTLIELTVALALVVVLMGLVIIRVAGNSSRQRVIQTARTLGRQIEAFRERAQIEERTFAVKVDPHANTVEFCPVREDRIENSLRVEKIADPIHIKRVTQSGQMLPGEATLFFDERGIIPDSNITISDEVHTVSIHIQSLGGEVLYDEL